MKLLSIDLETTGLDETTCQILEFGAVVFDTESTVDVETMPAFHAYLVQKLYQGEPFALGMHAAIFQRIAKREPPFNYLDPYDLAQALRDWLVREQGFTDQCVPLPVVCTGKNYAMFDQRFLQALEGWDEVIAVSHRVLDVGSLYFDPRKDQKIPDTRECLRRAGLDTTLAHTAVEDARNVIRLLRFIWSRAH